MPANTCQLCGALTVLVLGAAVMFARPPIDLIPIDEGIEDIDHLATDFRLQPRDLRTPIGFERVYRVPGRDDLYMRISGGLYAVFPRSDYIPGPGGLWPIIPPGTRFYPGGLPPELTGTNPHAISGGTHGPERLLLAQPTPAQPLDRAAAPSSVNSQSLNELRAPSRDSPSLWTDEAYRSTRLDALIIAAVSLQQ